MTICLCDSPRLCYQSETLSEMNFADRSLEDGSFGVSQVFLSMPPHLNLYSIVEKSIYFFKGVAFCPFTKS